MESSEDGMELRTFSAEHWVPPNSIHWLNGFDEKTWLEDSTCIFLKHDFTSLKIKHVE